MLNSYDIVYGLGVALSAPFWLIQPSARRKVLKAFSQRMGRGISRNTVHPAIMIHAVSLGEMNATALLVQQITQLRPDLNLIITTTTDTGYERGTQLYKDLPNVVLVRYPLDFSRAVGRFLNAMRPDVVVLMELEVWPNFLKLCAQRKIPALLINGRMTASSYSKYRLALPIVRKMFQRLAAVCAQDASYAQRFVHLGAPMDRVRITGTMKFDTAAIADRIAGDDELAASLGLFPGVDKIWVCGSTGPGEERIILDCYRKLLARHSRLRLVIVPRHPQRFDEVADLIRACGLELIRRSQVVAGKKVEKFQTVLPPVILGDTMGELRKFYSIADVVFVGRTLVNLGHRQHGSDMMEPAALARPTVVGRFTGNFAEVMSRFRTADAILEVDGANELEQTTSVLLSTPDQAAEIGRRAQQVVRANQGATERHVQLIMEFCKAHQRSEFAVVE